jgi:uncharacterized protein YjgD (DUF1641 family)
MSDTQTQATDVEERDLDELVAKIEANADDLAELLDLLEATQGLAEELVPELVEVTRENREPVEELRMAFEKEETLVLLQRVGESSEQLVELLDLLEVSQGLAEDLLPELIVVARENRATLERLRMSFEKEETIVLLEKLGDNADDLAELLDLLDATKGLAEELVPEGIDLARENREPIAELRMLVAGFADARADRETPDMYELGQNLENLVAVGETAAQPEIAEALQAGMTAFTDDTKPKKVGPLGLFSALRDSDVKRALGTLVEALRRMGVVLRKK